jgi:hypothetical protein
MRSMADLRFVSLDPEVDSPVPRVCGGMTVATLRPVA